MTGGHDGGGGRGGGGATGRAWREADAKRLEDRRAAVAKKLGKVRSNRREADSTIPKLRRDLAATEARLAYATRDADAAEARVGELEGLVAGLEKALAAVEADLEPTTRARDSAQADLDRLQRTVVDARTALLGDFARRVGVDVEALALMDARRREAERRTEAELARCRERAAKLEAQLRYEKRQDVTARLETSTRHVAEAEGRVAASKTALDLVLAAERNALVGVKAATADRDAASAEVEAHRDTLKTLHAEKDAATRAATKAARAASNEETAIEKRRSELHDVLNRARLENIRLPQVDDDDDDDVEEEGEEEDYDDTGWNNNKKKKKQKKKTRRRSGGSAAKRRRRTEGAAATSLPSSTDDSAEAIIGGEVFDADRIDTSGVVADGSTTAAERERAYDATVASFEAELKKLSPNMKAMDLYADYAKRHEAAEADYAEARDRQRDTTRAFDAIKEERVDRFMACYDEVSATLASSYADITKSSRHPLGGAASLALLDSEEPYNAGVSFHATPPSKRFCEISQLSGGERTLASLALLFALHSFKAAPFIVMDEVDAALDTVNVGKLVRFIKLQSHNALQIVAVSLKDQFYAEAQTLVGIAKDQASASTMHFSLDLDKYG